MAEALLEAETQLLSSDMDSFRSERLDAEIQIGLNDIDAGRVHTEEEVDAWLLNEYGI